MKRALVVEGGAMRGIFAAGVLDSFMYRDYYPFDFAVGVSAGATNLATYVTRSPGLSKTIITQYATKREFFSPLRFIRGGHMTDVHWLWQQCKAALPQCKMSPKSDIPLYVGVTNVETGQCEYPRVTADNIDELMVASCAIPTAYREQPVIDGTRYTDGGVADAIPVKQAYEMGARDITVILSQPLGFAKPRLKAGWLLDTLYGTQPALLDALKRRPESYNETLAFLTDPPADCHIQVVAPDTGFKVKRLTMDKLKLAMGYRSGKNAARRLFAERDQRVA